MTPLPLPLPVCLHGELLRGDLPLLCLLKGFTSVSALFHLQGLRLKFVSPWRLRVMSLSLLASPVIFLLWAWLVLCGHQLHGLCLVCSSLSLRLGWRRWDTQNSACTDPVFSFSGPDMYLSLACCIPVLSFITSPHFCHLPAVNIPNHRHSHQSDHRSACLWLWLHKDHQEHWLLIFTMLVSASEVHLGNLQIPHCVTSVKIRTEYSYGIRISHTNVSTKICFDWTIRSNTPFFFFFSTHAYHKISCLLTHHFSTYNTTSWGRHNLRENCCATPVQLPWAVNGTRTSSSGADTTYQR